MSVESLSARNKQPSRFLTINSKPSEFYMQKHIGDKNLIKLGTIGSARNANEDPKLEVVPIRRKSVVKSMGEIQGSGSSLNIGDHENVFPDTPGFRSIVTGGMMTLSFGPAHSTSSQKEDNSRLPPFRGSTFGMRDSMASLSKHVESEVDSGVELDDLGRPVHRRKSDTELKAPNSVVSLADPIQGPILKIPVQGRLQGDHAPDQEQEGGKNLDGTVNKRRSHRFATVHQINVTAVKAAIAENSSAENNNTTTKAETAPLETESPEPKLTEKSPAGIQKVIVKKGFTTNLLDLVNIRKDSTPTTVPEESSNKQKDLPRKMSTEISEELNTLSLISGQPDRRASIITNDMPRSRAVDGDQSKMSPLKFGSIEFLQNMDMVSPIAKNNVRTENVTPNSNRTIFMKQFLGVDLQDEKTITNLDYLSRGDFDKYSFIAEVKEVEYNNPNNTSQDDYRRNGSRKQTGQTNQTSTQQFRTMGSQDLLSPDLKLRGEFKYYY